MIVSWNWLTQYVRLDMPVELLADRLALAGLNHEGTEEVGGDLAIDLEVTSNRADCLSHLGVAREIAVIFGNRAMTEPVPGPAATGPSVDQATSVVVEVPELCPRFTARVVTGARVGESPWWMQRRLETIGVRPVSNLVDITNYVMFECGQPLHAYDLDRLAGRRLVVREAVRGERLQAINSKTYDLDPEMLVIADAEKPVGLAGVMGGLDSEIGPSTKNVLIEAALFDAMTVRRTARALGLFSPSSYRFERPMDPGRTEWASRRCAELILELAGGTLHEGVIDIVAPRAEPAAVTLRYAQIRRILGIDVPRARVLSILGELGLEKRSSTETESSWLVPSWRSDLNREIDLIEEVARIHGYGHIPEDRPVPLTCSTRGPRERVEVEVRSALTGMGFDEACTFSLVPDEQVVVLDPEPVGEILRVDHSSRRREANLRVSLTPSLLSVRAYNQAHGSSDISIFEIAPVYLPRPQQELPDEPTHLALLAGLDFHAMKGVVEAVLDRLHVCGPLGARPVEHPLFQNGRAAELRLGSDHLGYLGEIRADRGEALGLRGGCSAAELNFDKLISGANLVPQFAPLPAYPAVSRDLSLVVPSALEWEELSVAVRDAGGSTLVDLEFLDTFRGGDIPPDKHSLHFGMTFRHADRTLTGEEVDRSVRSVIDSCTKRFGAELRG